MVAIKAAKHTIFVWDRAQAPGRTWEGLTPRSDASLFLAVYKLHFFPFLFFLLLLPAEKVYFLLL